MNSFVYEMMVKAGEEALAAENDLFPFDDMLLKVANDDVVSFKNNNWLIHHPNEALLKRTRSPRTIAKR